MYAKASGLRALCSVAQLGADIAVERFRDHIPVHLRALNVRKLDLDDVPCRLLGCLGRGTQCGEVVTAVRLFALAGFRAGKVMGPAMSSYEPHTIYLICIDNVPDRAKLAV